MAGIGRAEIGFGRESLPTGITSCVGAESRVRNLFLSHAMLPVAEMPGQVRALWDRFRPSFWSTLPSVFGPVSPILPPESCPKYKQPPKTYPTNDQIHSPSLEASPSALAKRASRGLCAVSVCGFLAVQVPLAQRGARSSLGIALAPRTLGPRVSRLVGVRSSETWCVGATHYLCLGPVWLATAADLGPWRRKLVASARNVASATSASPAHSSQPVADASLVYSCLH